MKKLLIAMLALSTVCKAEGTMTWPELPTSGFLSGRAATIADAEAGRAIFSMDGKSLGPLDIEIPQYAILTGEDGASQAVIVVQAERAPDGTEIVGLRRADGSEIAATLPELRLLGTEKPG